MSIVERLMPLYLNYINTSKYKYGLIFSTVAIGILERRYQLWLKDGECEPLESLSTEEKEAFWKLTIMYKGEDNKRLIATKAVYAISIILKSIS